jgi:type IV secretory pathway TraG/TraD family ATPase VirD4
MPTTEMIVTIAVTAAVVLAFIHLLRFFATAILHKTVRKLVEREPERAESLIAQLGQPREASGDDRLSVILIAVGIAMIAASVVVNDPSWMHYAVAGALFPLIIGTALWLRAHFIERARRRGRAE